MNLLKNILFLAAILGLSLSGEQQAAAETSFGGRLNAPHTQPSSPALQLIRDHGHGHFGGMGGMPSRQMMSPPPSGGMRMAPPLGGRNLFAPRNEFSKRSFNSDEMRIRPYKPPFIGDGRPRPDRFHHRHRRHRHGFYWYTPSYPDYYYGYDIYDYDYRSCYLNCRKYHSRRYCRTYWRRYCD